MEFSVKIDPIEDGLRLTVKSADRSSALQGMEIVGRYFMLREKPILASIAEWRVVFNGNSTWIPLAKVDDGFEVVETVIETKYRPPAERE